MPKKKPGYEPLFIYPLLQRALYATLSNVGEGGLQSRVMIFACDPGLKRFFFLTGATNKKVADLAKDPTACLCVLSPSDKLDDHAETTVNGKVSVLDLKDPVAQEGLRLLAAKSSQLQAAVDAGSLKGYKMLVLEAKSVTFRIYRDVLQNVPATLFWL